jgi:hypothetical protein
VRYNVPNRAVSCRTVPYRTVPYRTVPYRTVPYRTVPYRTVPYRTVPYRTVPYRTVPYRTVPYHMKPDQSQIVQYQFHAMPCLNHTMQHHTITCNIKPHYSGALESMILYLSTISYINFSITHMQPLCPQLRNSRKILYFLKNCYIALSKQ